MNKSAMFAFEGLNENFQFLVLKIRQQVEDTLKTLESHEQVIPAEVKFREDYIDNLKVIIERKSYKKILKSRTDENRVIRIMGSLNTAVSNLEEIGDYLVSIVTQTHYFKDRYFLDQFDYQSYFREILTATDLIVESLFRGNIKDALIICRAEIEMDRLYKRDFDTIMGILQVGREIGDAITALNILRYLERVGDSLLNIGEAIISAYAGTRLKIFEYIALKETLDSSSEEFVLEDMNVETKSGCRIEKVINRPSRTDTQEVIFKEGDVGKLQQENRKLEEWQSIMPGLTPKVFGFQVIGEKAILLLEYLHGHDFQDILLGKDNVVLKKAISRLTSFVEEIWMKTKSDASLQAGFINQLLKKLPDVYHVHPRFFTQTKVIGSLRQNSLQERLERAAAIEAELAAPFSVFIHGDFNADNIIYNIQEDKIFYIDPHRSVQMDYVQDVSVFMVSNFRIPVFDANIRERQACVIDYFYRFAKSFAERNQDVNFDARLTLGIIRSLITSTRFIVKEDFAKLLYLRGLYLLDKLLDHEGAAWDTFMIPDDVFMS